MVGTLVRTSARKWFILHVFCLDLTAGSRKLRGSGQFSCQLHVSPLNFIELIQVDKKISKIVLLRRLRDMVLSRAATQSYFLLLINLEITFLINRCGHRKRYDTLKLPVISDQHSKSKSYFSWHQI